MNRIVNSIFHFIDEKEAIAALYQSCSNPKKAHHPITQPFQRNTGFLLR